MDIKWIGLEKKVDWIKKIEFFAYLYLFM